MKNIFTFLAAIVIFGNLVGCAITPDSIVQAPMTAKPVAATPRAPANGAIFQSAAYRPMFEDRRARLIGDTLIIAINEKTSAGKTDANSASKSGSAEMAVPSLFGLGASVLGKLSASSSVENKYDEKGAAASSNNFSGTITVTVIDVMPNGNLMVSGEKQVALDRGVEFVRFSGVVNPDNIVSGNTVSSTQVADARVEYRTNTRFDMAQMAALFSRFFFSLVPL